MAQPHDISKMFAHNGQYITEDNQLFNIADFYRSHPLSIARGQAPGSSIISAFGERTTSTGETNYPLWPNGLFELPPATGLQMSVVSTSANDSAAGTGIRQIKIHYLDSNLAEQSEIVVLNGLTPVLTVATDIRFIQCVHAHDVGALAVADGRIQVTNAGKEYADIAAGSTRCSSSFRMVPAGKRLFIDAAAAGASSGTAAAKSIIRLVANEIGGTIYSDPLIFFPLSSIAAQDSAIGLTIPPMQSFGAGAVVGMQHTTDKAATIAASWFGRLEPA